MKTIDITICIGSDGFYSAHCADHPALFGAGKTPEAAIEELKETLQLTKADGKDASFIYPEWLDEEYELNPVWDVESFLRYYSGIITPSALGRLSGINPKQIGNYMHGRSKPRRAQIIKIENALHTLGAQLSSISF